MRARRLRWVARGSAGTGGRRMAFALLFIGMALSATPYPAPAQASAPTCWPMPDSVAPHPPGRWLDWTPDVYMDPLPPPGSAEVMQRLTEFAEPFYGAAVLSPPPGVEVRPHRVIWGEGPADIGPPLLRANLLIQIFHPTYEEAGEASASVEVVLNSYWPLTHGGAPFGEDAGGSMFLEPVQAGEIAGAPVVYVDSPLYCLVVFKAHDRPLWRPVSRERLLRAIISDLRARAEEGRRDLQGSDTVWNEPPEIAEMRAAIREMRAIDPEAAAEMERQMAELKKILAETRPAAQAEVAQAREALGGSGMTMVHLLEAELAALTPEERSSPAYVGGADASKASLLSSPGSPGSRAVVTPNPDYFDWPAPQGTPQLIIVRMGGTTRDPVGTILARLGRELDWHAFWSWLR